MEDFKKWLLATSKRVLYTVVESILAFLVGASVFSEIDWKITLSVSLMAGVVAFLRSILMGLPEVEKEINQFK